MNSDSQTPAYQFQPHERPMMPGSPATPDHPRGRRIGYFLIGMLLALTEGFINGLLAANLPQIQGALGLTNVEGGWITAAYSRADGYARGWRRPRRAATRPLSPIAGQR